MTTPQDKVQCEAWFIETRLRSVSHREWGFEKPDVLHLIILSAEWNFQFMWTSYATHVSMAYLMVPFSILLENYMALEGLIWSQWSMPHTEASLGVTLSVLLL